MSQGSLRLTDKDLPMILHPLCKGDCPSCHPTHVCLNRDSLVTDCVLERQAAMPTLRISRSRGKAQVAQGKDLYAGQARIHQYGPDFRCYEHHMTIDAFCNPVQRMQVCRIGYGTLAQHGLEG